MSETEDAAMLLNIARADLFGLLASLPREERFKGRMILKAMAIAQRALGSEAARAGALGGDGAGGEGAAGIPPEPAALAAALRRGELPDDEALRARLRRDVRARLAVTNPRYLSGEE